MAKSQRPVVMDKLSSSATCTLLIGLSLHMLERMRFPCHLHRVGQGSRQCICFGGVIFGWVSNVDYLWYGG